MKTYMQKTADIARQWHLVDAKGRVLGEVAVEVAEHLTGKIKPTYTPHMDAGDYVVVINAAEVVVTGNKEQSKVYYRHSGIPGGYREETYVELMKRSPKLVIEHAVSGMLPKNKQQSDRLRRLKVFAGAEHTYQDKIGQVAA